MSRWRDNRETDIFCNYPEKGNTDATVTPDKGNTDANATPGKGNTSPQTGESFSILWVILAAIAAIGAVLFCGKKLIRVK